MQYVLVTGAYGGMGKATVNALKNAGYTVFALDKKVLEKEENVLPVQADVTSLESLEKAFEYVKSITDELFAIIHFAGIYTLNSLVEITDEEFCRAFEINVFGAYRINKLFLPLLKKGSKILLTTSELAPLDPLPFTSLYAVTKSTLDKYAYSLRMELQLLGISVAVLRAGAVDTGMLGVSTDALNNFCENTKIYECNAKNFKRVVDKVESRKIPPEKIAKKVVKIVNSKRIKYVYNVNRNPLLLLLNALPDRFQTWVIKKIIE